jgi:transcriptional regulator with XRE-family HTH domain
MTYVVCLVLIGGLNLCNPRFRGYLKHFFMTFGERITLIRKQLKWSQEDLAKKVGTSAPIIGRYERDEIKPSIEVAAKMAELLNVSLDYLVGKTDVLLDNKVMNRITEIQKLSPDEQKTVFSLLDAFLRDTKTRKAYAS